MSAKKFYITTPIYYPSGKPHIGHAYSTILADVICRYKALMGYDTLMQTGMDEHGQKIEEAAHKAGVQPREFVDDAAVLFLKLWKELDINYGSYIRTSEARHEEVVQKVFAQLQMDGYIYLGG
jgi:methionyl-tRNA synthetase